MKLWTKIAARGARLFLALTASLAVAAATRVDAADPPAIDAADRAAVEQACPCSGPAIGGAWRSHRDYASCVSRAVRALARAHDVRLRHLLPLLKETAINTCGVRRPGPANVNVCTESNVQLACETVRTAHADACDECQAAIEGRLVTCARLAGGHGGEATTCRGPDSAAPTLGGRVLEVRTGLDCASCEAKLGTPKPAGVSCLQALCGQL